MRWAHRGDGGELRKRELPREMFVDILDHAREASLREAASRMRRNDRRVAAQDVRAEREPEALGVEAAERLVSFEFRLERPNDVLELRIAQLDLRLDRRVVDIDAHAFGSGLHQ